MRIVVVGAGVIGLLTAVECVRAGAEVDLVDRADIPSIWSTSYDSLRVVRALHRGDAALTRAAAHLPDAWADLERRLGTEFYHRTGVLTAMPASEVDGHLAWLAESPARGLSAPDLAAGYPWLRFEPGDGAVFEPAAGTVYANRALHAAAIGLRRSPWARLHPHRRVVRIDGHRVGFDDGTTLSGDGVVVAAGPWSRDLLPASVAGTLTLKRQTTLSYQALWPGAPAVLGL